MVFSVWRFIFYYGNGVFRDVALEGVFMGVVAATT